LEAIALIAIFFLDWKERIENRKERQEQHKETAAQLAASQSQVKAAIKSADAATTSAYAAQESVGLMRQQFQEQAGLGHSVVQSAIESAISQITYWKAQPLSNLAKHRALPPTESLVPANALAAVDHARRIDQQAAQLVSSAFDDLRNARNEIDAMKQVEPNLGHGTGFFDSTSRQAEQYLDTAFEKLQKAQATLLVARAKHY
jgi:hypothetical protein